MLVRAILLAIIAVHTTTICAAQPRPHASAWSAGVIALSQSTPYRGGDDSPNIFPIVTYQGEKLVWRGPFLNYYVLGHSRAAGVTVSLDLSLAPHELEVDGDPALAGVRDRSNSLMAGVTVTYPLLGGTLSGSAQTRALGQHDGQRAVVGWQRPLIADSARQWQLSAGIELEYLSRDYVNYYFGVSELEAAHSAFIRYSPGAQFQPAITFSGYYRMTQRWMVLANMGVQALASDIKRSPIVGDDNVINGFVGVTYSF